MIKMVVDNAHKQNKWVGICGELASDLELTEYFLSIGVDELSVSPPFILPLRDKVRGITVWPENLNIPN
jgi:phosphotransferase system enzyme I (PtsI)